MTVPSLEDIKRAAENGDEAAVEGFLQDVLSGEITGEDHRLEAFRRLRMAGRDADLVRLISIHPKILEYAGTLTWAVIAAAGSGWPELVERLKLFGATAQAPDRFLPEIGSGPLLRCAYQLVQRGQISDALCDFVSTAAERMPMTEDAALHPVLVETHAAVFGAGETASTFAKIAAGQGNPPPAWINATLARNDASRLEDAVAGMPGSARQDYFPESRVVSICGTGGFRESLNALDEEAAADADMTLPDLNLTALSAGMRKVRDTAHTLAPDILAPYQEMLTAADGRAPILVLSTGRAGTRSINALLLGSREHAPYHFFNFHQEPDDLNRLFHRMLRGDIDDADIRTALNRLVHDRLMEILWSLQQGRRPVLVNHLDLVQVPLYLALFPDMDIVHIHRDPARTLMSHAHKMQFRYQQIRPLYGREDPASGQFLFARPKELSLEQSVVWFQVATELTAKAARTLTQPGHYHDIDMAPVFKGDPTALSLFLETFDDPGFSRELLTDHFSVPINEKSHYEIPDAFKSVERARDVYHRYRTELLETGRLV